MVGYRMRGNYLGKNRIVGFFVFAVICSIGDSILGIIHVCRVPFLGGGGAKTAIGMLLG